MNVFRELAEGEKQISPFLGWSEPEPETNYIWFESPLEIGGVTEAGLTLRCGCHSDAPDCHVTFEIAVRGLDGKRRIALARVCWLSLKGGHTNHRRIGPGRLRGKRTPATHIHTFADNWDSSKNKMIGRNLPIADQIDEHLQSFEDVRGFVGKAFKINNISVVTRPNWSYDLFHEQGKDIPTV